MCGVGHRENSTVHVSGIRAREIGGIDKLEHNRLAIRRERPFHARLVPCSAVVRHHQAVAIHLSADRPDLIDRKRVLVALHDLGTVGERDNVLDDDVLRDVFVESDVRIARPLDLGRIERGLR